MGLFDKLKEPVFFKETSSAEKQLDKLKELLGKVNEHDRELIKQDMKLIDYGLQGEKQIAFELKNSHMPMYILHDLYFEQDGLSAQIDYLVITRKNIFVLECKNLFGDITINQNGDFIRTMTVGGKTVKQGIYSPVTQNRRHLEFIKAMCVNEKKNFLSKAIFKKTFEEYYQSVVVLANPKTILKAFYAPQDIKSQVIRSDQLIAHIKKANDSVAKATYSDQDMEGMARFFLSKHIEKDPADYSNKYIVTKEMEKETKEEKQEETKSQIKKEANKEILKDNENLIKALKAFRLEQSRKENIKPYFIFNDKQMMELIEANPTTNEELIQISGFGPVKSKKYGAAILKLLSQKN